MPTTGLIEALRERLRGEVYTDRMHRGLVAQDASPYRVLPAGLVYPYDAADCQVLVTHARAHGLALIPRGGGTSLAGQCVGDGLVVDTSRYLTGIEWVDPHARRVRVQPGVTARQLNRALADQGLVFGPDPSTASRATVAGMLGNNAWGPHVLVDGSTRDQVVAASAILADGSSVELGEPGEQGSCNHRQEALARLLHRYRAAVVPAKAHADELCWNNGYPLHTLQATAANEAVLMAGAEGTLALITSLELRVRAPLSASCVLCPHFDSLRQALAAVAALRRGGARAVELLDHEILALTRDHPSESANRFWLEGEPAAVLIVEVAAATDASALSAQLRSLGACSVPLVTGEDIARVWSLRRAGLGLLMGVQGPRKPVSGMEDSAVAIEDLPDYIDAVQTLVANEGTHCVCYGSVGAGLVHLRPFLDLADPADRARYGRLLDGLAEQVRRFGGVWSTKHGDGRLRAPWLEAVYGAQWVEAMRSVKRLYDPGGLFNPGKVVDPPSPLADLRDGGHGAAIEATGFEWPDVGGLYAAAGRCHGAGACRQASVDGGMCPTYQATADELHGTRGRANLFQQAFEAADPATALAGDDLSEALSLCLACKACQHECPAQVDMARLKAEHLYQRYRRRRMPASARAAAAFAPLSAAAARFPRAANALGCSSVIQRLLGLGRAPPALAHQSLPAWLRRRTPALGSERERVTLLLDPHTAWYEPQVGRAAVAVLERLGYAVSVTRCVSTGRAAISQGALDRARRELGQTVAAVEAVSVGDEPVVGLEPSELLTLRDEASALVADELRPRVTALAGRALLLEELLGGAASAALTREASATTVPREVALHVHCHARALAGPESIRAPLAALPGTDAEIMSTGCCGMAGAFGYRRETMAVSRQVAELELAPRLRALPDTTVIAAPGVSCRQQIRDVVGRSACHPVEIVAEALGVGA